MAIATGCRNGSKNASFEIRKASRCHACYARFDSPCRAGQGESHATNADIGGIGRPQRSRSEASRNRTARPDGEQRRTLKR